VLVVLDDLHAIHAARESLRWLGRVIEDSPAHVRFLITCRGDCPLPLSRIRLQSGVVELGAPDLALTDSEEAELLASAFQLVLPAAERSALRRALGGWPAGVVIAAREQLRAGAPDRSSPVWGARGHISGPDGTAFDVAPLLALLDEEVVRPLPPRLRRSLIAVSALDELDPEAISALLGESEARALMDAISHGDLFVQSFPEASAAPRLHPLLHALLRRQFAIELRARERQRLLGRAARFWLERNQPARAVRLLSEGGATAAAARLLERTARAQGTHMPPQAGSFAALAHDLARQEPAVTAESPWLLLLGAIRARDDGRLDEAFQQVTAAATGFLARRDYPGMLQAIRAETRTAVRSGRFRGTIQHAERLIPRFPARSRALRGVALLHVAELRLHAGDRTGARRDLNQAGRILARGRNAVERAEISLRLAEVAYTETRWENYLALARTAIPIFQHAGYHTRVQSILINMAEACIYLGEERRALAHLDEARALGPRSWRAENQLYEIITRAYALTELGRSAEASAALAAGRELAQRFGAVLISHTIEVREGILARRAHRLPEAHAQLSAAVDGFSRLEAAAWGTFARMERGLVRGLLGDVEPALAELAAAARDSRRLGDRKELARNWLYTARVLLAARRDPRPPLMRALRLLDRERYLPVLMRKEAELLWPLLVPSGDEGRDRAWLARARAALPDAIRTELERGAPATRTAHAARVAPGVRATGRAVRATPTPPMPVTLQLLGGFAAVRTGEPCRFPRRASAALVAYLALHPGAAVAREELAEILWPGAPPAASRNRFDVALALARRALEPDAGSRGPFLLLRSESGLCRLDPEAVVVDVTEFERLADAADRDREGDRAPRRRPSAAPSPARAARAALAAAAYGGDLLPELAYASWVMGERERLKSRFHRLLLELGRCELAAGEATQAEATARRVLQDDPLAEDAAQILFRALAARGDRAGLIRSYRSFAKRMSRELDLDPSPDTAALFAELSGE
jgi:ATP/maltotriose-dependent transcriptional regulator MalT/two-component SAPR family response regulator